MVVSELLEEKLETCLFSDTKGRERLDAAAYLAPFIVNPDKDSDFDKALGEQKKILAEHVDDPKFICSFIEQMAGIGHDALLLIYDGEIIGHSAFQIDDQGRLHSYRTEILPEYRGRGGGMYFALQLLEMAREKDIRHVRWGRGAHPAAAYWLNYLREHQESLGVSVGDNGWTNFTCR